MGEIVRASDAERNAVLEHLGRAAAEGRLDPAELDRRLDAALAATLRSDLVPLTADLPAPEAGAALTTVEEQASVFGDLRVAGSFHVPERARWRSTFGDVTLDLRRATLDAARTHLEVRTVFGDLTLVVADGTRVEVQRRSTFGGLRQQASVPAAPEGPCVLLSGRAVFGDTRVLDHTAYENRWTRRLGRRLLGG